MKKFILTFIFTINIMPLYGFSYYSTVGLGISPAIACATARNLEFYISFIREKNKGNRELAKEMIDNKVCYQLKQDQFVKFIESHPFELDDNLVRTIKVKIDSKITNEILFSLQKRK